MTEDLLTLQKMQVISWICLAFLTFGSAVVVSFGICLAGLVGGVISIGSFWVSHNRCDEDYSFSDFVAVP